MLYRTRWETICSKSRLWFQPLETGQSTLTNVERKMSTAGALDDSLFTIAFNRLKDVEGKIGEIAVGDKLIFLESWARTLAMSMR